MDISFEGKLALLDFERNAAEGIPVSGLSSGSHRRVWLRCEAGHSRFAEFRSAGKCPFCSGVRILAGCNDLETLYPRLAAEWHPTANGALSPRAVGATSHKKVYWLCPRCGYVYDAYISNRSRRGDGCPACSMKRLVKGNNDFATVHPELLSEWDESNTLCPSEVRATDTTRVIVWRCADGNKYRESVSRHLLRHERANEGYIGARRLRIEGLLLENEDFLAKHWSYKLNGFDFRKLKRISQIVKWGCCRCGVTINATVAEAIRTALLCERCRQQEADIRRAKKLALIEINRSRSRSFGQTAIAFYLNRLNDVSVEQEVPLLEGRRFRVDIVVTDTVTGRKYAVEHDGARYHSSSERRRSDEEKLFLMRQHFDRVFRIACTDGKNENCGAVDYSYSGSRLAELEQVIKALISDMLGVEQGVDIKRDTMRILRMKQYVNSGSREWHRHVLERLEEDFIPEENEGFRLSDFSPTGYYHAHWRCKRCGGSFLAAISNRVRGDGCPHCTVHYKKILPADSFAALFPEKAKNWAEGNAIGPTQVAPHSGYVADWRCGQCGHAWQAAVNVVARSKYLGCEVCGAKERGRGQRRPIEAFDSHGAVALAYDAICLAERDGFPKVARALKSGAVYKGYIWRYKDKI